MNLYRKSFALLVFIVLSFGGLLYYSLNLNTEQTVKDAETPSMLTDHFFYPGREGYYVRHCITYRILGKRPNKLQTIPFEALEEISSESAEKRKSSFESVFKNKAWIPAKERKNDSRVSGPGSTLQYAQDVIGGLHSIISQLKRELNVDRIRLLDIPCGDMMWMSRFLKTRDDVDYTGLDIVPDLINRHRKNYASQSNWNFRVQDIVRNGLNESYDLILCRMMLQHLPINEALTVIKHFSESGSRFLLTTSFNRAKVNHELPGAYGKFRTLNLELPPFSLTPPVCLLRDGEKNDSEGQKHFLGLWRLPARRVKLCNSTVSFRVEDFGVVFFSCVNWS